jgi:FkbM family methyltransferase
MINFSKIPHDTFLGKFLRLPLRLIPRGATLPILQGALRGKRWVVGSGVFGYWLGTYERDLQDFLVKKIKRGTVVFDIGANVGFFTLLASALVGESGRVFAFEPSPRSLAYLKRHIELNGCTNVTVVECAVSDRGGYASFEERESNALGRISPHGTSRVPTVSIDDWIAEGRIPVPDFIKLDVEDSEASALKGMVRLLESRKVVISVGLLGDVYHFLKSMGYHMYSFRGDPIRESDIESRGGDMICFG